MNVLGFILVVAVAIFAVVEIFGFVRDIKARKRARQEQQENIEKGEEVKNG